MKRILTIILSTVIALSVCACGGAKSAETATAAVETTTAEETLSAEDQIWVDAKKDEIFTIFLDFSWKDGFSEENIEKHHILTFDELIQSLKKISSHNSFAKSIVKHSEKVKYSELNIYEKMVFDSCLKLLFRDMLDSVDTSKIGSITDFRKADDYVEDTTWIFFKTMNLYLKMKKDLYILGIIVL